MGFWWLVVGVSRWWVQWWLIFGLRRAIRVCSLRKGEPATALQRLTVLLW